MRRHGGARLGDRTMIDALEPALKALVASSVMQAAARTVRRGADETARITKARAGRPAHGTDNALLGRTTRSETFPIPARARHYGCFTISHRTERPARIHGPNGLAEFEARRKKCRSF